MGNNGYLIFSENISDLIPMTMINLAQELELSTTCSCEKTIVRPQN